MVKAYNFINKYTMSTNQDVTAVTPISNSYDKTLNIVHGVFGATYFVLQGLADLTLHAEANVVHKISKGEISIDDAKDYRKAQYAIQTESMVSKFNSLKAKK
jgi:hypothetical protein